MVSPILKYGSEILEFEFSESIEEKHVKYCKGFLGLNTSTNNLMSLRECGQIYKILNKTLRNGSK